MDKLIGATIAAALIILAFTFMGLAWRARARRAHDYTTWPALDGEPRELHEVYYVATTLGSNALERVALKGFTYRGFATLEIFTNGLQIRLKTNDVLTIPTGALVRYEFAQVAIDKAVEKEGLIGFTWTSAPGTKQVQQLTTFVRLREASARDHLSSIFSKLVSETTKEEVA
ncbi:MAG: hypothetical protein RLZZ600_436 [Actinomycetota bacterium]